MPCPFCNTSNTKSAAYPANQFNNKKFEYVSCNKCHLVYLKDYPDSDDYTSMYPPAYQSSKVESELIPDVYKKMPGLRYSYGYQFDLIKKQIGAKASILDYGCGTGHFIANALANGFEVSGAEFSADYIPILNAGFPGCKFYTIDQVLGNNFTEKYNVIRLSNVLEHLTTPADVIKKLSNHLHSNGILLIEGPVEENFSLAMFVRKMYFKIDKWIRPTRVVFYPPYHIFFSNAKNQRQFFNDCGLLETHFNISESAWPFPESIKEAKGIKNKLMAIIAKGSIAITKTIGKNRNWGNVFIYTGKNIK